MKHYGMNDLCLSMAGLNYKSFTMTTDLVRYIVRSPGHSQCEAVGLLHITVIHCYHRGCWLDDCRGSGHKTLAYCIHVKVGCHHCRMQTYVAVHRAGSIITAQKGWVLDVKIMSHIGSFKYRAAMNIGGPQTSNFKRQENY